MLRRMKDEVITGLNAPEEVDGQRIVEVSQARYVDGITGAPVVARSCEKNGLEVSNLRMGEENDW